ncbi:MAG: hypothetical protein NTW21_41590 [Verrucomicrobia bacterium]|nr:hypothetical protein [Verrucomicrobiota bacterium]
MAEQRAWDKEIDVWLGTTDGVLAALPSGGNAPEVHQFDLLDLIADSDSDDEVALSMELKTALRARLQALLPASENRRVLIVKSAPLLVHFNLGLHEFFDWFCSDRAFVLLQIDGIAEALNLPQEFEFSPRKVVDYFTQPGLAKNVYH